MAILRDEPERLLAIRLACVNEDAAVEYMERQRWGDHPKCAYCGAENVYRMIGRDGKREQNRRWRCRSCKRMYSVKVGTVMQDSRLPVKAWVVAFWRSAACKNGVAALELQRELGINYRSALFMLNRIREAMSDWNEPNRPKMTGTVEADETYIGGKPRVHHRMGEGPIGRGTEKTAVFGMGARWGASPHAGSQRLRPHVADGAL